MITLATTGMTDPEDFEILEETANYVTLRPPLTFNGETVTGRNVASQCQHVHATLGMEVIAINPLARFMLCKRLAK